MCGLYGVWCVVCGVWCLVFGVWCVVCGQSVVATGGVYKGQGRNQRELMTRAYWEFLVHGEELQAPIPSTKEVQRVTRSFRTRANTR